MEWAQIPEEPSRTTTISENWDIIDGRTLSEKKSPDTPHLGSCGHWCANLFMWPRNIEDIGMHQWLPDTNQPTIGYPGSQMINYALKGSTLCVSGSASEKRGKWFMCRGTHQDSTYQNRRWRIWNWYQAISQVRHLELTHQPSLMEKHCVDAPEEQRFLINQQTSRSLLLQAIGTVWNYGYGNI